MDSLTLCGAEMTLHQKTVAGVISRESATAAVCLEDVTKTFGVVRALQDVTLRVRFGQVYGILGPNGAGKTTMLRALLGLVRCDAGTVRVLGRPPADSQALRRIGALIESPAFVPQLSGRVNLRVLARARALHDNEVSRVLRAVGMEEAADRRVAGYSLGMRQRLGVAAAMLGDPWLLILDEPTNGLDPDGMAWMRALIRELGGRATVLLSSHLLGEVQQVCDRVVVLDKGKVVAEGSISALLDRVGSRTVAVWAHPADVAAKVLSRWPGVILAGGPGDSHWRLDLDRDRIPALVKALVDGGAEVHEVRRERQSLEQVFFDLTTGRDARAER
jgi:ABC-2 type transport system ATP-binding protein